MDRTMVIHPTLEYDYAAGWAEWAASDDRNLWELTDGDGLIAATHAE
jgi:hypothetical protein